LQHTQATASHQLQQGIVLNIKLEVHRMMSESCSASSDPLQQQQKPADNIDASPNQPFSQPPPDNLIPESLLALAKDARYIQQCQELLLQFLSSFLELIGKGHYGGDHAGESLVASLHKQSWILSHVLYTIFVVAPLGRTLGMQALGLTFGGDKNECVLTGKIQNDHASRTKSRRRNLVGSMLLTCATGCLLECYIMYHSRKNSDKEQSQQMHGRSRRDIHEQLRQQMLARAARSNVLNSTSAVSLTGDITNNSSFTGTLTLSISRKAQRLAHQFSQVIQDMAFHHEGPHEITNASGHGNMTYSMATWLVRLHLAQYLITGKYPTILHRLLGLQLRGENEAGASTAQSAVPARPNSQKVLASLILIQASSTAVQKISNWMAQLVASNLEKRRRVAVSSMNALSPEAQLQNSLAGFFSDVLLHSIEEDSREAEKSDTDDDSVSGNKGSSNVSHDNNTGTISNSVRTLCTICRTERKHSAAPVSCGHICCWNCLNQWVINVRPECPLCRAPCKRQEIILLHQYEPALENDGQDSDVVQ
jgi:peroxin-10